MGSEDHEPQQRYHSTSQDPSALRGASTALKPLSRGLSTTQLAFCNMKAFAHCFNPQIRQALPQTPPKSEGGVSLAPGTSTHSSHLRQSTNIQKAPLSQPSLLEIDSSKSTQNPLLDPTPKDSGAVLGHRRPKSSWRHTIKGAPGE